MGHPLRVTRVEIQEHYLVPDPDHFTYRLEVPNDDGKNWVQGQIEMTFQRQAP